MKKNIKKEYNLSLIEKKWPSFAPAELRKGKQKGYGHLEIEKKWQKRWAVSKIYKSKEDTKKKKFYVLDMFPYPSGEGLHVGHPKGYIATDVISRYQRMKGYSVLHPMGFDAFGLPAENYALKTKTNPADSVKKNVMRFKKQLELIGLDYDWSREINTTDPKYYKWTQWIFLQLFKKGLAYESYEPINWCPSCKTGLANEDVENGHCERCGTLVEKKPMRQWVLKITDYAERLLNDLDAVDTSDSPHIIDKKWPPRPGKKVVERRTIHALVRDPKTGKFLGLRWKKFPWTTFIVGGVELSEGAIEAAKREVEEETGYCNLKFMQTLGGPVKAEYYAAHKDQNRVAITTGVLFELASDEKKPVSAEEEDKHETIWMDPRDLTPEIMTCAELPIWLKRLPTASMGIFQGAPLFTQILEPGTVRTEIPSVERNAIMAIVKHWSKDKYIGLKWKKVTWRTLITGGPENGQTPEEGAIAEIMEETGYLHPKLIKNLGKIHSKFFHVPKNVNRFAHFDVLYFELKDGDKNEISGEEKTNHEVMWLSKEEMVTFLTPESHKYAWLTMFQGKEMRGEKDEGEAKLLLDWPESIKELQRNWIGKSEGTEIQFTVGTHIVEVFTTRPDTLFGVTYMVLAPEHKLVSELLNSVENKKEVEAYIKKSKSQTEIQRTDDTKEKTGVELKGIKAVNPANNEEVPVWIADYVLADYGTGAVMAVPAHDERDWDFAKKYGLPVKQVIAVYQTDSEGKDRVRPDKETVKRKTVYALLFDEKNDRFLCLNWEKFGWHSGIIGGVDDGESFKDAAVREIREETGYVNIEYIKNLGMEQHNYFFAAHKDVNRYAFGQGMLFKLINEEKVPVNEEETKNHKTIWIKSNDMESWLDLAAFKFMWNAYKSGSDYFTGNGKIINSAKFNGMESEKAIKEISSFVGGKQVTKYKLRDWVFSRQRYWG
ncbi:MAG: class I tRNA ligase family protein, partial [bacterium]|nr:class I tRNA ligase family protein [bacterium]